MTFAARKRVSNKLIDKSIKQGRKESPSLINLMMKSIFRKPQTEWKDLGMGVTLRRSEADQEEEKVSHMIFADKCYLFAETKKSDAKDDW